MRFRNVYGIVFRKELRELLRDKRSLFWLFAPPIILPGLAICAGLFIGTQAARIARDGFPVVVENGDQAPDLVQKLEDSSTTYIVEPPDPATDPYGEAMVIVSLPDDFNEQLTGSGTASVQLLTNNSSVVTWMAKSVVRGVIEDYSRDVLDQRLAERGLSRDWLDPITISEGTRATSSGSLVVGKDKDGGGNVLTAIFLPLAVTSWLIGGGLGLVLDTTVGEKERQTIENLLVTPASRTGIVLGKLTVVFLASVAVLGLWLAEGLLLNAFGAAAPDLFSSSNALTPSDAADILLESGRNALGLILILVVLIIPFIITLNGLVMAWCAHAANYREANLFMALLQLGLPASILLTIFSLPSTVSTPVYAIPLFGTIVAIRDLFSNALPAAGLWVNVGSGLVYAALSISAAAWMFSREWSLTRGLQ